MLRLKLKDLPPEWQAQIAEQIAREPKRTLADFLPPPFDRMKSKLEIRYGQHLELLMKAKLIESWKYEPVRLKLARNARFTPDFEVRLWNTQLEYHETKGWAREAAIVRIKVAASLCPHYRFKLVRWIKGAWVFKEVLP